MAAVERAARSVRLSLALAARLDGDEPVRRARVRADTAAEREAAEEDRRRARDAKALADLIEAARRDEIVALAATDAFEQAGLEDDEIEERIAEVRERLCEGEWEFDVSERPIGAVLAAVLQDQEVEAVWSLWVREGWAIEEVATDAEGSPYARGGVAWVRAGGGAPDVEPPDELAREPAAAGGSSRKQQDSAYPGGGRGPDHMASSFRKDPGQGRFRPPLHVIRVPACAAISGFERFTCGVVNPENPHRKSDAIGARVRAPLGDPR